MTTKKTTTTRSKTPDPVARVTEAETHFASATEHFTEAVRHRDELQERNANGDSSVSGLEILTANADVDASRGLRAHAEAEVDAARTEYAAHVAAEVAEEVAATISTPKVEEALQEAGEALCVAVAKVIDTHYRRDVVADEAGRRLSEAGVPTRVQVGPVMYRPVTTDGTRGGREIGGQYDVAVDGEWLVHRVGHGHTRREVSRVVEDLLTRALRDNRLKWTTTGIENA